MFVATLLIAVLLPQAATSQRTAVAPLMQVRQVPDEAVRRQARLSTGLAPSARMKIAAASQLLSQKVKALPAASPAQMQDFARAATMQAFPALQGTDVDMLMFLVMSEAAKQQQAELQAQMSQMQQQMAQKQAQRSSMNEMGEMQQMRLQSLMDQRSKMLEALSNIMKATSDTQSGIVQNLK